MNPTLIFDLLNLVEMFSYSILFNLKFHEKFIEFIVSLKKSSKLPSIELCLAKEDTEIPSKYSDYGIESSLFIVNSGYFLFLITTFLILTGLTLIGARLKYPFISNLSRRLKKVIFFSWFHRICLQGCFDLLIFAILSLNYTKANSFIGIFDFICCVFILVSFIQFYIGLCTIIQLNLLKQIQFPISSKTLEDRYPSFTCFFQELKCNSWSGCLYNMLFIARRVALSLAIIYLNGIFQITIGILFTLAVSSSFGCSR